MKKKRAVILGAGISGLSAAHALMKTHDVVVLERTKRAGGWLETICEKGFLFETGPRTFRSSNSQHLLALVEELGLQDQCIFSDPQAEKRYLLFQGQLEKIPKHPVGFLFSPILRGMWSGLLTEWKKPVVEEEETVWDFAKRRFGVNAAERFFDALSLGVYAADSRSLSVDAAFPQLKTMEKEHGSITRAILHSKRKKHGSALFSFQKGTQALIDALTNRLGERLCLHQEVQALYKEKEFFEIRTVHNCFQADIVVIALPPHEAGRVLEQLAPAAAKRLRDIAMTSLSMVQLGYDSEVLPKKGFGYLVPSIEKLPIYGVMFDSCIFPSQNEGRQTRLTVMMPPLENAKETALSMIHQHLGIDILPNYSREVSLIDAIPLPRIGHAKNIKAIQEQLGPNLFLAGNYLQGVSVNDCIARCLFSKCL